MSAGLKRVPSFSGRPGFPNGLQVSSALCSRSQSLQLRRDYPGVQFPMALLNPCRCWLLTETTQAAAFWSRNSENCHMRVGPGLS